MRRTIQRQASAKTTIVACMLVACCLLLAVDAQPPLDSPLHASAAPYTPDAVAPLHTLESVTMASHKSAFPSMHVTRRSEAVKAKEIAEDARQYARLHAAELAARAKGLDLDSLRSASRSRRFDTETVAFLEEADSTLRTVLGHDGSRVHHYKSLMGRANAALAANAFDEAATLYREASALYFEAVAAPYAPIASSAALGRTIQSRIASSMTAERLQDGVAGARTAVEEFRAKEMSNRPHVMNAFEEYKKTLKQKEGERQKQQQQQQPQKPQQKQQEANKQ